ncbi:MAG: hypothetical protein BWZ02_01716 [Lentisphaerae bacterium ADurb.BinA184]|nr:MAG: hypothetical protein BWZ02_01716 [Lentisphaerae bacterium ADurb.BinA184]
MTFHSCMTLFALRAEPESLLLKALHRHFGGRQDANALRHLEARRELPLGPGPG